MTEPIPLRNGTVIVWNGTEGATVTCRYLCVACRDNSRVVAIFLKTWHGTAYHAKDLATARGHTSYV